MTQAAGSIGQGLVENYTFTKEAFRTYLKKLTPGGRLVLKLHGQTDLARAVFTAVQVLGETVGEARATKHLYILKRHGPWGRDVPRAGDREGAPLDGGLPGLDEQGRGGRILPRSISRTIWRNSCPGLATGKITTKQAIAGAPAQS